MSVDIDADLDIIAEQIAILRNLSAQPQVSDATLYDFSIRWGTVLAGRVPRLIHYRDHRLLSATDSDRVHDVCAQLRALTARARRLGLAVPRLGSTAATTPQPTDAIERSDHDRARHPVG